MNAYVFFSYAAKDEALRDELEKHLAALVQQGVIRGWHAGLTRTPSTHADAAPPKRGAAAMIVVAALAVLATLVILWVAGVIKPPDM